MPNVADKVLTERFKELGSLGVVEKRELEPNGSVFTYWLTARGESLRPVREALYAWGDTVGSELQVTVGA